MSVKEIKQGNLRWINISMVDEKTVGFLKDNFQFHHLDLEDIQSESQTPKIDVYKNYLFLVLHFPQWKGAAKKVIAHEVDIFVGKDYIITIQHGKNKEIKNFFYRCMNNRRIKADWMSHNSGYLLYKLLEALFSESRPILNNLGRQISGIENEIFAGEQDIHIIKLLALHRRNILHFRRIIDPQKYLMSNLSHIRKPFIDESLSVYFDNVKITYGPPCPILDQTGDCKIDFHDFARITDSWSLTNVGGDLNQDGKTNLEDLNLLVGEWLARTEL